MKKYLLAVALSTMASGVFAQNGINTPYSRYGFGILSERAMGFNKGMGGVAQGFRNGQEINIANPASYSAADSVTSLFDIGLSLQNGNYKMDGMQQNIRNTSFDYFSYQFRAAKGVGVAVSVMPVSNIKYNFASASNPLADTENVSSSYAFSGDGGLREVMLGAGWSPIKQLSVGVNASYMWGDYSHKMTMNYSENSVYGISRIYSADISTYNLQAGVQYTHEFNSKNKIVVGATYTLGHNINNDAYRTTSTTNGSYTMQTDVDTIGNAFQMPSAIAAGITYYHSNHWRVGADFELQQWSDCVFPVQQTGLGGVNQDYTKQKGQLNDRMKVALGCDYCPSAGSNALFKRATYKVGGYYSNSYANADLTGTVKDKPTEFGLSAGVSLPIKSKWLIFPNNVSKLNVAVQWVHTNIPYLSNAVNSQNMLLAGKQSTLSENYLKVCIGMTINECWFYKWKLR